MPGALTARERAVIAALAEAFVPASAEDALPPWSGVEAGVVEAVEETMLTALAPEASRDLRRLLAVLDHPVLAFALTQRAGRFADLSRESRERVLASWATSRLGAKRRAFQAVKRLVTFLYYARLDGGERRNRAWAYVGYAGPDDAARARDCGPTPPPLPSIAPQAGATVRVDVCVIGSGAGGGVAAAHLARSGFSVLVLEAGDWRGPASFTGREVEGNRDLYEGEGAFASSDLGVSILAGRTAGGGTSVNWMTCIQPPPWLRAQWAGLGLEDVASKAFDEDVSAVWARIGATLEESRVSGANGVLAQGCRRLGYREGVDWRVLHRNALGCRNRCDFCVFGCVYGARRGTLATYLEDAAGAGARFAFRARAQRILHARGRATGVLVGQDGREFVVEARAVLLGAGAVHSAALLLRSGLRARGVGRLFIHPATAVIGRFPQRVAMWEGPMQTVVVERFRDLDGSQHGVLLEAVPGHPGLSASALPWTSGQQHKRDMADLARSAATLVLARDARPGRVRVNARGEPVVEYRLSQRDARHLTRGMQEAARIQQAAGAQSVMTLHAAGLRVEATQPGQAVPESLLEAFVTSVGRAGAGRPNDLALFTAHQMGTVALGRDGEAPATPTGRLWDVEGLYVVDGSAFPTPSGVNPMVTIMSLAQRTARHIAADLKPEAF